MATAVHERICSPSKRAHRLNRNWECIAADNPGAAYRVLDEIHEGIRTLVLFAQLGHICSDLSSRPLRFHRVGNFLIAYAPDERPFLE